MGTGERDLWTCPRCGARFVTMNMSHGCDWVHHFVLRSEADLDEELRDWMREAYDVGRQTHLAR